MESSLYLDDDGKIHITRQTSATKFKTRRFLVSDLSSFKYQSPGMFKTGSLEFFFRDGTKSEAVVIPQGQKRLFSQLVDELQSSLDSNKIESKSGKVSKSYVQSKPKAEAPKSTASSSEVNSSRYLSEDFVSLDIEWTDSSDPTSVCEVGLVIFSNGVPTETFRSYVRPRREFIMGGYEQRAHGIHKNLILNARTIDHVWPKFRHFIDQRPVVAHNATNDINKLLTTLISSGVGNIPDFDYFDTMLMAKKLPWVKSKNGLSELAEFFGIEREYATYDDRSKLARFPHGALEDAMLTGQVLIELMNTCGFSNLYALNAVLDAYAGEVRESQVKSGFSVAGKFKYSGPDALPSQSEMLEQVQKSLSNAKKIEDKRRAGDSAKDIFLTNPQWSEMKVQSGNTVCFTQLASWDDFGNDHKSEVMEVARKLGIKAIGNIRSDLELLVVNDPWVVDSAKLRDALGRKVPIPVTLYSIFQKNNPEFPVWNYKKSEE
jgi:DNA polymerase III epsilon subunit-like protein